jgi:hypothetical protein
VLHDRKYFYKYVTPETALLILQNRTVRYSSPTLFNDPFDIQTRLRCEFEESEFLTAYRDEIFRLFHGQKEPRFIDNTAPLCREIQVFRRIVEDKSKMTKEIFDRMTEDILEAGKQLLECENEEMNIWWMRAAKATKVFCVAEMPDNLLMWAHYSKDHTGAVIEFECLPDLDTPLCAARKVNYVEKPPFIAEDLDAYVQYITGQATLNHEISIYDLCLSKSDHWKYEQEWRVFIPPADMDNPTIPIDANGKEILFDLLEFLPQEIRSIYLGCRMTDDNRQKILSCLSGDLQHVKKYKSVKSDREYRLNFEEIIA